MRSYSRAEQIRAEQLGRNGEEKGRSAPCAALGGFAACWIAVGSLLPYGYHSPWGRAAAYPLRVLLPNRNGLEGNESDKKSVIAC